MWLKAFQINNKLLSESEFWLLSLVRDTYESPTVIMDRLYEQTRDWTPKPGTIYPALHRLAESGLLDKDESDGLQFRRNDKTRVYLSSITKPLRVQIFETCNYYRIILENLSNLDNIPSRYEETLIEMGNEAIKFGKSLKSLAKEIEERKEAQSPSFDVKVTFED